MPEITGAINGTSCLIYKGSAGTAVLAGQMEFTATYGGTPIDISNKSNGDYISYLDGEGASKQLVLAGTLVYNDDATCTAVRADALAFTMDDYVIKFASTGETISGKFMPNAMSDTLPHGDKVSMAITLSSSGEFTRTPRTVSP